MYPNIVRILLIMWPQKVIQHYENKFIIEKLTLIQPKIKTITQSTIIKKANWYEFARKMVIFSRASSE